jgi:hypothetical protein
VVLRAGTPLDAHRGRHALTQPKHMLFDVQQYRDTDTPRSADPTLPKHVTPDQLSSHGSLPAAWFCQPVVPIAPLVAMYRSTSAARWAGDVGAKTPSRTLHPPNPRPLAGDSVNSASALVQLLRCGQTTGRDAAWRRQASVALASDGGEGGTAIISIAAGTAAGWPNSACDPCSKCTFVRQQKYRPARVAGHVRNDTCIGQSGITEHTVRGLVSTQH